MKAKKLLSILLTAAVIASFPGAVFPAGAACAEDDPVSGGASAGDVDSDGSITANDALMILRVSIGMDKLNSQKTKIADYDGDGTVTASDALSVLRKSIGISENSGFKPVNDPIYNAKVGDVITFGKYEQDNNLSNGPEKIKWRVLSRDNDKLFVVTESIIDRITYDEYAGNGNWCDSGLRYYLNSDFYNSVFTPDEKRCISDTYLISNEGVGSLGKKETVDKEKIFLLSMEEVKDYFSSNNDRVAYPTPYARANGLDTDDHGRAIWWLRSLVSENYTGAVYEDGFPDGERGGHAGSSFGLRPVMWIDAAAKAGNGSAGTVSQPMNMNYLPQSLRKFFVTFAYHYYDGTYDCENITEDSNILLGVIGESECVDYSVYSDVLENQNAYKNWKRSTTTPSPIPEINNTNIEYKKLDADEVDNILRVIFHCSGYDIARMRTWKSKSKFTPYGYSNGYYYCGTGGHGDMPHNFTLVESEYRDGCYYLKMNYYAGDAYFKNNESTYGISPYAVMYAKVSLAEHEGTPWWTLYYYSKTPFGGAPGK